MANGKRKIVNVKFHSFMHSCIQPLSHIPYTLYLIPLYLLLSIPTFAQRSEVNDGVEQYKEKNYADAEVNFKKGKEKAPENFEAHFNLGDAFYKQGRYDESLQEFYSSIELTDNTDLKSKAYHNIGNSLLKSEKFKESIEAYKNALKINPNDQETKYNLSYALKQLEKQQQQQNQDQNKDQNKDKNEDQNKDKDQQNDKNDKQDQNKPDQNEQTQQDNTKAQQQPNQISKEEAERILQALKNNEQDMQKKIRKKTGVPIKREKDW